MRIFLSRTINSQTKSFIFVHAVSTFNRVNESSFLIFEIVELSILYRGLDIFRGGGRKEATVLVTLDPEYKW